MKRLLYIIICVICLGNLHAQKNITGTVKQRSCMVGDAIEYSFSIPKNDKGLNLSSNFAFSDTVQLISNKTDTLDDKITYNYTFVSFVEGTHKLPEFQFYAPSDTIPIYNVSSPMIEITVPAIDTVNIEVKPLKNIIGVPLTIREILPFAVGGLILAGIVIATIYFIRHKERRPKILQPKPEIVIPEDEEALNNLNRLKQARLLETGQAKQHYITLSEILWQYIFRRFDVNAFEMTTAQIMENIDNKEITVEDKTKLNNIFSTSDLVKFAKYIPDTITNLTLLQDTEDFIRNNKHVVTDEDTQTSLDDKETTLDESETTLGERKVTLDKQQTIKQESEVKDE